MSYYPDGALVETIGTFADDDGDPTDTTASLVYGFYDLSSVTPVLVGSVTTVSGGSVTHAATGVYTSNIDTTGKGGLRCYYNWKGTGAVQEPAAGSFQVTRTPPT